MHQLQSLLTSFVQNFKSSKSKTPSASLRKNRGAMPFSNTFPLGLSIASLLSHSIGQ